MEGPILADCKYVSHDAIEIIEYVTRRNPQGFETSVSEHGIALGITARIIAHRVRLAVNLNYQPPLETGEIGNIPSAWKLATKAESVRPLAEVLPQDDFRQGQLAT